MPCSACRRKKHAHQSHATRITAAAAPAEEPAITAIFTTTVETTAGEVVVSSVSLIATALEGLRSEFEKGSKAGGDAGYGDGNADLKTPKGDVTVAPAEAEAAREASDSEEADEDDAD